MKILQKRSSLLEFYKLIVLLQRIRLSTIEFVRDHLSPSDVFVNHDQSLIERDAMSDYGAPSFLFVICDRRRDAWMTGTVVAQSRNI